MGRPLAISLTFCAAVLVLLGTLTIAWWSHQDGDWQASLGLQQARFCNPDGCRVTAIGGRGGGVQWVRAGSASYAGGFVAGGLLLAMLVTGLLRREHELLIKTAMVASASTSISALVFVWLTPDGMDMSSGYSMYCYFIGTVIGLGSGVGWLRRIAPAPGEMSAGGQSDSPSDSPSND